MDLQDKITAPLGLATLDKSSAEAQSPEQYAINTIGGRALQTANTIAQKSGQAIKAALAEPVAPRAVPVGDWPTYRKASGAPPYTPVTGDSFSEPVPAQNPPMQADGPPARGIDMPCPLPDRPQAPSAKQGKRTTRSMERRRIPTEERGKPPAHAAPPTAKEGSNEPGRLQLYERPALATYQNTPLASGLQNQGPGLALAGESSAGLQSVQAAGQAAEGGASAAASSSAGPVAIAYQVTEKAVTKMKETVENIAVRAQSSKQTLGALAALFLVPLLIMFGIAGVLRGGGFASNVNLSADVLALMPQINAACQTHGIPEYAPLAAAVMMQESGGNVALTNGDVMQCAESLGYPAGTPVPVEESINHGVGVLAHKLARAGSTGPTDIPAISLALQAYNYGNGYFDWAAFHGGGYSKENALSFQQYQISHGYPGGYGDASYVDHVLRYYQVGGGGMGAGSAIAGGAFTYPCEGHGWNTYPGHEGIDIPLETGAPVYACAAGTVTYAQAGWHSGMGVDGLASYGNCVFIDHGSGWQSRYAHMSSIVVASGTPVQQGQLIGYVGSTGNSSGPHLHLALYYNGSPSSNGVIYAEQAWPQYKN
ncbi:peptidoglycan DD-metalloendopeptidase family protein [Oscillospiraceae bacterium 21-37]